MFVEVGCRRIGVRLTEVEISHRVDRHDVQVGVGHLETGDHEANSLGCKQRSLGIPNLMCSFHEMRGCFGREVDPLVGLRLWDDENVSWCERSNVEECDAKIVIENHARWDVAIDDFGEDGCHAATLQRVENRSAGHPWSYPADAVASDVMESLLERWQPFTVPNLMSFVRLLCVPLFVVLLFGADDRFAAALLLGLLGATDWVDGWFARRYDQVSELGKILDPTADRLLLLTAVLATWIDGSVPWWFALATLVREVVVSLAAIGLGIAGVDRFDVTWWGKTGAFFLMFAYPLLLAGASDVGASDVFRALGWICGVIGLAVAWYAAAGYVPIAREALDKARSSGSTIES